MTAPDACARRWPQPIDISQGFALPWWNVRVSIWVVVVCLLVGGHARADEPWAAGVSEAHKQAAEKLLDEGNALFLERKYSEALAKYQAAKDSWDHPAIRFNIVRCLIQLNRPIEAIDHLEKALAYGSAPLEPAVYTEALAYQKLLARQVGDLEVACQQDGVRLTLDGRELATCPARQRRRVEPGQHQVVATKQGFMTRTIEVFVIGGKQQNVAVALEPLTESAKVVHRWPIWLPWLVFGSGVTVTALGGGLEVKASSDMASYDRQVARDCAERCDPGQAAVLDPLRASATFENRLALGFIVTGAATAIVGGTMLYMNRARTVYPSSVEVAPMSGGAMLRVQGWFGR